MNNENIKKRNELDSFVEKRLLNTLYHQTEFLDKIDDTIFSSSVTRNVYKSINNLVNKKIPLTRDSLLQEFSTIDLDASSTIIDLITQPQNEKLTTIKDILDQLEDFKKRRKSSAVLRKAIAEIEKTTKLDEASIETLNNLINEAEFSLTSSNQLQKVMNMGEWFDNYNEEFIKRRSGKQLYFRNFIFDKLIEDGPRAGEIGILSSQSGSGKSTVCLNLISDFIDAQIPCMYFSLEMSSITTMDRLLSKRLEIKYRDIVNPKEQSNFDSLEKLIKKARTELEQNEKFRFSENATISLDDLKRFIKKFQTDIKQNYCIVVIDLLSMISDFCLTKGGFNFAQIIELGMNKLSCIAKELGVHIIGVLQLNRSSETEHKAHDRKDLQKFRPNRAQIKNAHAFLERARYVITTFREKMYAELYLQPEEYENMIDIIDVSVVKINNGQLKRIQAIFNGEFFSIEHIGDSVEIEN